MGMRRGYRVISLGFFAPCLRIVSAVDHVDGSQPVFFADELTLFFVVVDYHI